MRESDFKIFVKSIQVNKKGIIKFKNFIQSSFLDDDQIDIISSLIKNNFFILIDLRNHQLNLDAFDKIYNAVKQTTSLNCLHLSCILQLEDIYIIIKNNKGLITLQANNNGIMFTDQEQLQIVELVNNRSIIELFVQPYITNFAEKNLIRLKNVLDSIHENIYVYEDLHSVMKLNIEGIKYLLFKDGQKNEPKYLKFNVDEFYQKLKILCEQQERNLINEFLNPGHEMNQNTSVNNLWHSNYKTLRINHKNYRQLSTDRVLTNKRSYDNIDL